LAIGGLIAAGGVPLMIVSGALVLGGYASGAVQTLGDEASRPDYAGIASAIEERWSPGDVVVDGAPLTPVPQTGLDLYLPQTHPEIRLNLPVSDRPFLPLDPIPPLDKQIKLALRLGDGESIFLLAYAAQPSGFRSDTTLSDRLRVQTSAASTFLDKLPPRFEVRRVGEFGSVTPLVLFQITDRG
jgi:hypothetical protein